MCKSSQHIPYSPETIQSNTDSNKHCHHQTDLIFVVVVATTCNTSRRTLSSHVQFDLLNQSFHVSFATHKALFLPTTVLISPNSTGLFERLCGESTLCEGIVLNNVWVFISLGHGKSIVTSDIPGDHTYLRLPTPFLVTISNTRYEFNLMSL